MFDTQQAADELKDAGADERLARAIVKLMKEQAEKAVTKTDLNERLELTEARLSNKIGELRTEMKDGLLETARATRNWIAGAVGLIALLVTLFEFIH